VDDLYAIPRVSDDKKHLLETRFMRQIDQKASNILDKIEKYGTTNYLTPEDRLFWATFLISIMQRNPEKVEELSLLANDVYQEIFSNLRESYPTRKSEADPETFDEFLQAARGAGHIERHKALLLQDAILLPQSARLISSFHWGLCAINQYEHKLLTSDRPIVMSNGLGHRDGHMVFPLGPRKLFLAARTPEVTRRIIARPDLVAATNNAVARQACQYVYGTDDTQLVFVEKRLRRRDAPIG